ncbi:MAG: T9SS type A sorting domain-containing protein, partial [Chitinophagaceae bacterium]
IDIDKKGSYSKIVALRLDGLLALKNFTIYPNPFTTDLKLQISSAKETAITIRINNAAGQLESNYSINVQAGENIVVLSNLEMLKPGLYFMEIISEDGKFTNKIIKR